MVQATTVSFIRPKKESRQTKIVKFTRLLTTWSGDDMMLNSGPPSWPGFVQPATPFSRSIVVPVDCPTAAVVNALISAFVNSSCRYRNAVLTKRVVVSYPCRRTAWYRNSLFRIRSIYTSGQITEKLLSGPGEVGKQSLPISFPRSPTLSSLPLPSLYIPFPTLPSPLPLSAKAIFIHNQFVLNSRCSYAVYHNCHGLHRCQRWLI